MANGLGMPPTLMSREHLLTESSTFNIVGQIVSKKQLLASGDRIGPNSVPNEYSRRGNSVFRDTEATRKTGESRKH